MWHCGYEAMPLMTVEKLKLRIAQEKALKLAISLLKKFNHYLWLSL